MKVHLRKLKKLLAKGPVQFIVGVGVGIGAVLLNESRYTMLVLKRADVEELKSTNDYAVYDTDHGPIFVGMRAVTEGA